MYPMFYDGPLRKEVTVKAGGRVLTLESNKEECVLSWHVCVSICLGFVR